MTLPSHGISYDHRFKEVIDQNYDKTGSFSIGKLALYSDNFENNDIISKLR
jgi:hypothetical protein